MARLLKKQGLQALDPLAALNSFLPRALREVLQVLPVLLQFMWPPQLCRSWM